MGSLNTDLRRLLESTVLEAREAAEKAARAALIALAVPQEKAPDSLSESNRNLRVKLRAEARRLGDGLEKAPQDSGPFPALAAEVAYGQWHRLLFARFLAENDLLIYPDSTTPVSLQDCADIAEERGEPDAWVVASEYAAAMLPGIFRSDDPILQVRYDAAGRLALEALLMKLPRDVFLADDSLGWVYQFWQAKRKAEVNKSGRKIGGADIAPVTQLFTEHYMVQFLLHNSLGAWWEARNPGENLPTDLDYLRRDENGTPAAGTFSGWPERAADLKVLDPSCGSGHFLVAAFALLRRIRMAEEGLDEAEAGDAVLRDNLFGLELDPRCTQIATFNLCVAAWKAGGYRKLPPLNIACSGLAVGDRLFEWTRLAEKEEDASTRAELENTLRRLYHLFREAPNLGSLIDPIRVAHEEGTKAQPALQFAIEWKKIAPLLEKALAKGREQDDPAAIFGPTAEGALRAADLLMRKYTLVITNVPYLGRGNQGEILRDYSEKFHNAAKADLATAFVERCLRFCAKGGSVALVTPQNWLFLGSYQKLRENLLKSKTWNVAAKLGENGFQSSQAAGAFIAMFVLTNQMPGIGYSVLGEEGIRGIGYSVLGAQGLEANLSEPQAPIPNTQYPIPPNTFLGLDASAPRVPAEKAEILRCGPLHIVSQPAQLKNPDFRIALEEQEGGKLLENYAVGLQGIATGDYPRFGRCFWELPDLRNGWVFQQSTVEEITNYHGREHILHWEDGKGALAQNPQGRVQGLAGLGKKGVACAQMRVLCCTLYTGELFDNNCSVILPRNPAHLPAIWAFCSSPEFNTAVRRIDQKLSVTNATLVKVPFDLERWQKAAAEQYPDGLPEPHSDDPTQWLFHGSPARSTDPLHVAMARLLGYRWPEHGLPPLSSGKLRQEEDGLDAFADSDGIVCVPLVNGEPPAEQRLRALLAAAYSDSPLLSGEGPGEGWSPSLLEDLLAKAGYGGKGLEAWLRDGFFAAHCRLFHNRPFLWHIWDGEKDGFAAIVNYHKLDRNTLDRLIYTYLGDWLAVQRSADAEGVPGAGRRLKAATDLQTKLQAIAQGESPYDIFVRWKPLHQQPIGWEPDLNDGVRLNIRPFVTAGILRGKFTINWNKDRGSDPKPNLSGTTDRLNDLHFTRAVKEAARRNAPVEETSLSQKAPKILDL